MEATRLGPVRELPRPAPGPVDRALPAGIDDVGQLDGELTDDGWIVGQLAPDELWQPDSSQLWSTALRRKGGSYALLARMPENPSVN